MHSSCKLTSMVHSYLLTEMIAILVATFIHSSKTVLVMSAKDSCVSSSQRPFVVYTTSGNKN